MLSIRQVVQDYGRSCERILSPFSFDSPLSEEEAQFIHYYLNEVAKSLDGALYKPTGGQSTTDESQPS